jgi:hypothetical protein
LAKFQQAHTIAEVSTPAHTRNNENRPVAAALDVIGGNWKLRHLCLAARRRQRLPDIKGKFFLASAGELGRVSKGSSYFPSTPRVPLFFKLYEIQTFGLLRLFRSAFFVRLGRNGH